MKNAKQAIKHLKNGDSVIFPTDTVYGIGCNAYDHEAVKKIFKTKNRSLHAVVGLNANRKVIKKITKLNKDAKKLMKHFWPGGLTLVVPVKHPTELSRLTYANDKVGVRIPNNPIVMYILKNIKFPIISTSANKAGTPTANTAKKINIKADFSLSEYKCALKEESTYYDVMDKKIIRHGVVPQKEIEKVLGYKVEG